MKDFGFLLKFPIEKECCKIRDLPAPGKRRKESERS